MVSHLGRHSTEQHGAIKSVEYMTVAYGSSADDILVWLSPSPNGEDYPLWAFANRSFNSVLNEQFAAAGITPDHIESSPVDTVSSLEYYSHSEYLKGNRSVDGRYAIVAMLQ
jgi:copper oxidase (laccase) domain-containing protein